MDLNITTPHPDISDHSRWRLQLTVGDGGVRANFYDAAAGRLFTYLEKSWRGDPADSLRKIEDAIYEDPAILDDYTTGILIRPSRMIFVPDSRLGAESTEEDAGELLSLVDASDALDVWSESLGCGFTAVFSTPAGVRDFLSRTFPTEDVHLALRPMLGHVLLKERGPGRKMWVHLDAGTLDVVAAADGFPVLINTREYQEAADAAYYIVHALRAIGFDAAGTDVRLSGREELRKELMPMLRRHMDCVSAALLPTCINQAIAQGASLCGALNTIAP